MSDEEINRAIAEACGYVPCNRWVLFNAFSSTYMKDDGACEHQRCYPVELGPARFFSDLNAIHTAEASIQCGNFHDYTECLREIVFSAHPDSTEDEFGYDLIHATAAQRAEAFLRAVGKWKEETVKS